MTDKPEEKYNHKWVKPPPGAAPGGWICPNCGYKHDHPAAKRPCGEFFRGHVTVAQHDFNPYVDD